MGLEVQNGWRVAMGLAATSQLCAVVFYLKYASGSEQPWAYAGGDDDDDDDDISRQDEEARGRALDRLFRDEHIQSTA